MGIETIYDLIQELRRSKLIKPERLEQIVRHGNRFKDVNELTKYFLHRGWLTPYQVNQLLQGHGRDLVLGPYRILESLGQGGTGQVFKAIHQRMNRLVALKFVRRELLSDPMAIHRFYREIQAAAQLMHPNIVLAFDADEVGNTHFFAMEYVDGADLHRLVQKSGPLPIAFASDCIRQAALGLQHACDRGMVHRDIKPANLIVTMPDNQLRQRREDGGMGETVSLPSKGIIVKILDMGLARLLHQVQAGPLDGEDGRGDLTMQGSVVGTPDYVAPEQALDSREADIRSDLYSLGCTFYYLLTGQPPFPGGTIMRKLLDHQQSEPKPLEELRPEVPKGVVAIVRKMMAKRPQDRYQAPEEVAAAIADLARVEETAHRTALKGHADWVRCVAFAPDGRTLACGDGDGTVWLWDLTPGSTREPFHLKGHTGNVYAVAFAPAGNLLASAGWDRTVRLWDLSEPVPRLHCVLKRHGGWVRSLAFSPDGKRLASGGADLAVRLWDLTTLGPRSPSPVALEDPAELAVIQEHHREVRSVTFSPDGQWLASASWDRTVRLLRLSECGAKTERPKTDLQTGRIVLRQHTDAVLTVAFDPLGRMLATGGNDKTVRLWDLTTQPPREIALLQSHVAAVYGVAFSPSGKVMATGSYDGQLLLWECPSGKRLGKWELRGPIYCLAFSPDGQYLAAGISGTNGQGTTYLLRVALPGEKTTALHHHSGSSNGELAGSGR
jgi:serine/threonine-protein kinase